MAISHINGISVSNISHWVGVAKANISAINGVATGFGGSPPTIDYYTGVLVCGFECGQLGADGQHWTAAAGISVDTGTKRNGDRSLRVNLSAAASTSVSNTTVQNVNVGRCYLRFASLPSADTYIVWTGGVNRVGIAFKQSSSTLHCATAGTPSMAGAGISVTTGVWYRVDFKLDQTDGANVADGKIDGADLTQATASNSGVETTVRVGAPSAITTDHYFDDFVISQTGADYPIGAGYVNHFIPVSDGTHNTGAAGSFVVGTSGGANITNATTDSYQLIDDVPMDDTSPDTGDFINQTTNTGGGAEYVEHVVGPASGISTPTEGPRAIDVLYAYHAAAATGGNHTFKINDNGTEDTVNAFNAAGSTSTRYGRKIYNTSPASATNWHADNDGTNGDFRDLRVRFGYSTDANPDQYLDCVMVEAEFSE